MNTIARHIKAIMLVSGTLTFTMVYAALFPQAALQSTFGESLQGALAELIVRNWGALIALVGLLMIHGAFNPSVRRSALLIAGASKALFIVLVLSNGRQYLSHGAGPAVALDAAMVVLVACYLARGSGEETQRLEVG